MQEYVGKLNGGNTRIAIVISRFNEKITRDLLSGALDAIERFEVNEEDVSIAWVPGAFEIPIVAKKLALSGEFDAIVCLGAIIKGATYQFEADMGEAAGGIARTSYDTGIPVIFQVLMLQTLEQGVERSGGPLGNRGFDAVQAAIEMVDLLRQLPGSEGAPKSKKALARQN